MKQKNLRSLRSFHQIKNLVVGAFSLLILSCCIWFSDKTQQTELPKSDTPPSLYSNQCKHNLTGNLVAAIKSAKQSVLVLIYSMTDKNIMEALRLKREEGIPVTVICDAKASPYIERYLGKKIKVLKRYSKGLMHLKLLVVDGKQVWIGSANFTQDSLEMHGNLVMSMENPALAEFIKERAGCMDEAMNSKAFDHRGYLLGGQKLEFWFLPDDRHAASRVKDLIRSAKKTVKVAMFTWTRDDFVKEIVDARLRGVEVEIAVDSNSSKGAGAKVVGLLKQNGLPVKVNKGAGLLHHKFVYIDGKTLVSGSANWTKAAFNMNDDCFVVLHDLTKEQHKVMEQLWKTIKLESK